MISIDLLNELSSASLIAASQRSAAATTNGTGLDITQYDGVVRIAVMGTVVSGTSPTLDVKIQDSADNSTFADVPSAAITQVTTGSSLQIIGVDTRAVRQYIRTVDTVGGTTPVVNVAAVLTGRKQLI